MTSDQTTYSHERPDNQSKRQCQTQYLQNDDTNAPDDQQTLDKLLDELSEDLKPLAPTTGVERYIDHRTDITDKTKAEYRNKLEYFLEYLAERGIDDLTSLSGREIEGYRIWRREESTQSVDSLSPKTMRDDMFLLRSFIEYLESIEAVSGGLHQKVQIPDVEDGVRDVELKPERVERILEYLDTYEYATIDHVLFVLLAETGRRIGGVQSLDLDDYNEDRSGPYLEFCHRPGETRLKNREKSEAQVSLSSTTAEILEDYINTHRHDVLDDHGRQPLLTTQHGRPAISTLRRYVYAWTRPCQIGEPCPHNRSPDSCEAASETNAASKCDSSRSPHALRHGNITELLRHGISIEVIQDRCDVSEPVLRKHYDERSEDEKRRHRNELLDQVRQNGGGYL